MFIIPTTCLDDTKSYTDFTLQLFLHFSKGMAIFIRESKTPTAYGRKVSKCRLNSMITFL